MYLSKKTTLIENARYQHPMQEEEFYSYSKKLQHTKIELSGSNQIYAKYI